MPLRTAIAVLCLSALPTLAAAQGNQNVPASADQLETRVSAYEGYDDNVLRTAGLWDRALTASGFYSVGELDARYRHPTRRATISFGGSGAVHYYPEIASGTWLSRYGASAGIAARPGQRTTFNLGGFGDRRTAVTDDSGSDFVDTGVPQGSDGEAPIRFPSRYLLGGRAALAHQLTLRSDFEVNYMASRYQYIETGTVLRLQSAGGHFDHQVSRDFSANLGYRYDQVVGPKDSRIHTIEAGGNYSVDVGAHTQFGFASAVSLVPRRDSKDRWRVGGRVSLQHQFTQGLSGTADYRRGVRFFEGISDAVTYDYADANLAATLSKNLSSIVGVSYTRGNILVASGTGQYNQFGAQAELDYNLARRLTTFVRYQFRGYDVNDEALQSAGAPGHADRNSVRVGFTWRPATVTP